MSLDQGRMFGNLAPHGARFARAPFAASGWQRGPARVFETIDGAGLALVSGSIVVGDIVVIRGVSGEVLDLEAVYGAQPESVDQPRAIAIVTDATVRGDGPSLVVSEVRPSAADGGPLSRVKPADIVTVDVRAARVDADSLVGLDREVTSGLLVSSRERRTRPMELQVAIASREVRLESLRELAQLAEAAGYTGLWAHDHLLPPSSLVSHHESLDPLILLTHLAEHTRSIRLGTSILVLPMRNPFVVAKQIATLDIVCGGRLTLGVGAGYSAGEFANVHATFEGRGRRLEEAIDLLRHLFSGSREGFAGDHYSYDDGVFGPLPAQGAGLPIMIGGHSQAALRRAARRGDIWQSSGLDPERFRETVATLRGLAPDRDVVVSARARIEPGSDREEIERRLRAWYRAGAELLVLNQSDPDPRLLEQVAEVHQALSYDDATEVDE